MSMHKPAKSTKNEINVPTMTKAGKQRKREQEADARFNLLEREVNGHIELAKERARKANELITLEISETTKMLHACEIEIGEIHSKIDNVQSESERKKHEEELAEL